MALISCLSMSGPGSTSGSSPGKALRCRNRFCLLLVVAICAGCARLLVPAVSEKPPAPSLELAKLRERSESWRDYQCKFRMRVDSKNSKFSSRALILEKEPNFVRFETFTPLGQTAALYVSNETGPLLMIPSQRAIFTAKRPETLAREFLGIDLPVDLFLWLLTASVPPEQLDHIESSLEAGVWHLISTSASTCFEWQISAHPPALQGLLVRSTGFEGRVSYDPPVLLTKDAVPDKILISSSEWSLEISLEALMPAPQFRPSIFYLPNLPNVQKVDLDKIK